MSDTLIRGGRAPTNSTVCSCRIVFGHTMDHALPMNSTAWAAYLDNVYAPSCARARSTMGHLNHSKAEPNRSLLFFFYRDQIPLEVRPIHAIPLLGLHRRWSLTGDPRIDAVITPPILSSDAYRSAVPTNAGRAAAEAYDMVNWTGRQRGDLYHLMCMEGSGASACTPLDPHAASRVTQTLWVYPYLSQSTEVADALEDAIVPLHGFPSHQKVEVFHCAEREPPHAEDYWLYLARGSGIYFDLGRTVAFRDRLELFVAMNATRRRPTGGKCRYRGRRHRYRALKDGRGRVAGVFTAAGYHCATANDVANQQYHSLAWSIGRLVALGYDSLQLTRSEEHGVFKYELVDLRQHAGVRVVRRHHVTRDPLTGQTRAHNFITLRPPSRACPNAKAIVYYSREGGAAPCRCTERAASGCLQCARPTCAARSKRGDSA